MTPRKNMWLTDLSRWYAREKRSLPWRDLSTPYAVWVSEIMLQQTQVDTVIPYYRRFMSRFPSICKLASADIQDVLKTWEGLGYYTRARHLHEAARILVNKSRGVMPRTAEGLRALPGIGPYASGAIASISYGEPVPAVDGNVLRVIARLRGMAEDITKNSTRQEIHAFLAGVMPRKNPGNFNQSLMELGALICRPRNPNCRSCPLRKDCVALQTEQVSCLPVRPKRKTVPHFDVVACVIRKKGKVLISRRRTDQMLGGLWEFPGGKCKAKETLKAAAVREIEEEIGIRIVPGRVFCAVKHAYSHFKITLHAIECKALGGRASAKESDEIRWVLISRLKELPFPAGDRKIIEVLEKGT